ncbi:MAG: DsrE/DsrF/DrsH-like family protein [Candidatus Krumholzibacteria bacterium]|jgi:peroxiredoxin family protein|nr:DsrE/DsrF/DrsH-like family protein [Candidatus Krumholzibacteria bacterium]MDP6669406.1 DsrE/DsrF/DrsH-like family protein [Candidatus Krumholzibacteria bacterium]MDP6798022.1 DsrE/DsrF/DrsH-like family protein [Candidatus Krumholzibacteria bacterium]MDP7021531.1 DsrE/DsrF/DrsH-like family protein [Candidatus Krumholzibacteria bacterium]
MEAREKGLAVLLTSGTFDKILSAINLSASAVALGRSVDLFLAWEALLRFAENTLQEAPLPSSSSLQESALKEALAEQGTLDEMLAGLRSSGLQVYACSATLAMLKLDEEVLKDRVDGISGATAFLARAETRQVINF